MAVITKIPLPTNATNNITGIFSFFQWIQQPDVSKGWFMSLLSLAIAIIIFIGSKEYGNAKAFTAAAFFNMIFSIIMSIVGFISPTFMYLSIVFVAVAAVWLHLDNTSDRV